VTKFASLIALVALLLFLFPHGYAGADPLQESTVEEALDGANFYIVKRPNYQGSFWVHNQENNDIIGHAPWDPVNRRWTLFTLTGEYFGFLQATVGAVSPPHFVQYLWYGKDNEYKGVFVAKLGGRPVTKDLPYGELGGELELFLEGDIPLPPPAYNIELDPLKRFPEGIDVSPVDPDARE
jgi:hypothetical protein